MATRGRDQSAASGAGMTGRCAAPIPTATTAPCNGPGSPSRAMWKVLAGALGLLIEGNLLIIAARPALGRSYG